MIIPEVNIVKVYKKDIWIADGMMGERVVMMQHEGHKPFEYAVFNYDYLYTNNSQTHRMAHQLAVELGAKEPIRHATREIPKPSADELRELIAKAQQMLAEIEQPAQPRNQAHEGCITYASSSRICQRGTKSCIVEHVVQQPRKPCTCDGWCDGLCLEKEGKRK